MGERECRLRGLLAAGEQQELVVRLSHFDAYWREADLAAAMAERVVADTVMKVVGAETAQASAEDNSQKQPEDSIEPDPQLDGEALDETDVEFMEGQPDDVELPHYDHAIKLSVTLPQAADFPPMCSMLTTQTALATVDRDAKQVIEPAVVVNAEISGKNGLQQPQPTELVGRPGAKADEDVFTSASVVGEDRTRTGTRCETTANPAASLAEQKIINSQEQEKARKKALLMKVEREVMKFQAILEANRERPDLVAMKCDKKRMELMEQAAQQEAILDMKSRAPTKTMRPAAAPQAVSATARSKTESRYAQPSPAAEHTCSRDVEGDRRGIELALAEVSSLADAAHASSPPRPRRQRSPESRVASEASIGPKKARRQETHRAAAGSVATRAISRSERSPRRSPRCNTSSSRGESRRRSRRARRSRS